MVGRLLQSWAVTVVLIAAIVWTGFGVLEKREQLQAVEKQETHIRDKIAEIEDSQAQIGNIDRDTYLERQAREKLNYKYPGEQVVHVFRDDTAHASEPSENTEESQKSNLHLWWNYILGN